MSPMSQIREHLLSSPEGTKLDEYAAKLDDFISSGITAYNGTYKEVGSPEVIMVHFLLYNTVTGEYRKVITDSKCSSDEDKAKMLEMVKKVIIFGFQDCYPVAYMITSDAYCSSYEHEDVEDQELRRLRPSEDPFRKEVILHASQGIFGTNVFIVYDVIREVPGDETSKVKDLIIKDMGKESEMGGQFSCLFEQSDKIYERLEAIGISVPDPKFEK